MSYLCPKCNAENQDGNRFCVKCGTALPQNKHCVKCGAMLPLNSKFCSHCGTQSVSANKQRVPHNPTQHRSIPIQKTRVEGPTPTAVRVNNIPITQKVTTDFIDSSIPKTGRGKGLILVAVGLACIAIIVGAFFLYKHKTNEDRINRFVQSFADKASKNDISGLKSVYPAIVKADSIALPNPYPKPKISESADGLFHIQYSPTVSIMARKTGDNAFTVTESYGLFVYAPEAVETAKSYELWHPDLNDLLLSENIKEAESRHKEDLEAKEDEAFASILPDLNDLRYFSTYDSDIIANYLRSLGYQGFSYENGYEEYDGGYRGDFKASMGSRSCHVKYNCQMHSCRIELTITGDKDALKSLYYNARQLFNPGYSDYGHENSVTMKGETIIIDS